MDHGKRHLKLSVFLIIGVFFHAPATAQPASEKNPGTFRLLATGTTASGLLYETAPGKPVPVEAGGIYLSQAYKCPNDGALLFYRIIPPAPPDTKPRRVQVSEVKIDPSRSYIVVLASSPSSDDPSSYQTKAFAYDDSWDIHPYNSTRILNFSKQPIAVQLTGDPLQLSPGESHLFPIDLAARAVPMKVARLENEQWILKLRRLQRGIPNTRLTLLVSDVIPTIENPNPTEINLTHIFDTSPPPEKP